MSVNKGKPQFLKQPEVIRNPNPRAPLTAILKISTDHPAKVLVRITDGIKDTGVEWPADAAATERSLPLVGMKPDRLHLIHLKVVDDAGRANAFGPIEYRTPPLPAGQSNFPIFHLTRSDPKRLEGGIAIFTVRRRNQGRGIYMTPRQRDFMTKWSMLVGIDTDGDVVWTYKADVRIAGIEILANGNIFYHSVAFRSVEIDMLGNEVRAFYASRRPQGPAKNSVAVDAASIHHQPHCMPNGNFLAMTANAREIENYYTSDVDANAPRATGKVVGDRIIEFTPEGKEVWSWNTFDHLDPFRIGFGTFEPYWDTRGFPKHCDWSHGNGVTYDHKKDTVIISLKHMSAIVGIDKASGEIRWIIGNDTGWSEKLRAKLLKPVGPFQMNWNQHNPRVTRRGTILFYDNGTHAAMPFAPAKMPNETFSRAAEFEIDEKARTVKQAWASATECNDDSVCVWAMGDAHELPRTGNVLIVDSMVMTKRKDMQWNEWDRSKLHPNDFPYSVRIREVTRQSPPEVLWELETHDPDDIMSWEVFGAVHVPTLWAGIKASVSEAAAIPA